MKHINCKVGDTLIYDDGREGHKGILCVVVSAGATSMVVQFADRADSTTIKYNDKGWMDYLVKK